MMSLSCGASISAASAQPSRTLFPSSSASHFPMLFPSRFVLAGLLFSFFFVWWSWVWSSSGTHGLCLIFCSFDLEFKGENEKKEQFTLFFWSLKFLSDVAAAWCSPFSVGVKCSYAESSSIKDATAGTIDVLADIKTEKIVVLGGSGFVGTAICRAAISKGIEVISVSRSGRPSYSGSWVDQVSWVTGDVFYINWDEVLAGATAVVSTLGGFGSEEQMLRINGEANILAVNAAKNFGIPKFVLISVHDYNLPSFLLTSGYFTGKRKAESEVLSKYPSSGVVFRPGFIYGKRMVDGFEIPLDLIGEPLEKFLSAIGNFTKPLNSLPASDLLLAPPVNVDDLAFAVVNAIRDDYFFGVFTIEQIKEAAAAAKV